MYVDGFNLYHAVEDLEKPHLKWLSLTLLGKTFLSPEDALTKVCYFSALQLFHQDKSKRHKRYIAALEATGVTTVLSKFLTSSKYCRKNDQYCEFKEEKQTDVAFSVQILSDAIDGSIDKAILVTADSDHVPLVKALLARFPHIEIILAAPPGRMRQARELGKLFNKRVELTEGRMLTCLLPRVVHNAAGHVAATCPLDYARPWESGWT